MVLYSEVDEWSQIDKSDLLKSNKEEQMTFDITEERKHLNQSLKENDRDSLLKD